MTKRIGLSLGLAFFITMGLFYFMASLVTAQKDLKKDTGDRQFIDFVRVKNESDTRTRSRKLPEKPPEPEEELLSETLEVASNDQPTQAALEMDIPNISAPFSGGDGPFVGAIGAGVASSGGNSSVVPLVRIEPQYPRKAAMKGVEGYVVLKYDITTLGTVENVDILDAKPRRMFDSAAKRALLKWKFKPKLEEGKPVAQKGLKVQLDFKLENR